MNRIQLGSVKSYVQNHLDEKRPWYKLRRPFKKTKEKTMARTNLTKEVKNILSQEADFMKPLLQSML